MPNRAVCVLGMHRSGTSALTGTLQCLGVPLGNSLMAATPGVNDLGYFEHEEIVNVHDGILRALNSVWDDVTPLPARWWEDAAMTPFRADLLAIARRDFADTPLWALKDPRLCRTMPIWFEIFETLGAEPVFLHMLRHPGEVAGSLTKRNGFITEKSYFLWIDHTLRAERASRGHTRAFMKYDALLDDAAGAMTRIGETLGIEWPTAPGQAKATLDGFLKPSLRHHRGDGEAPADKINGAPPTLEALAGEVYRTLAGETPPADDAIGRLQAMFDARIEAFEPALVAHIHDMMRRRIRAENHHQALRRTGSWYVTKPLRFAARLTGLAQKPV